MRAKAILPGEPLPFLAGAAAVLPKTHAFTCGAACQTLSRGGWTSRRPLSSLGSANPRNIPMLLPPLPPPLLRHPAQPRSWHSCGLPNHVLATHRMALRTSLLPLRFMCCHSLRSIAPPAAAAAALPLPGPGSATTRNGCLRTPTASCGGTRPGSPRTTCRCPATMQVPCHYAGALPLCWSCCWSPLRTEPV